METARLAGRKAIVTGATGIGHASVRAMCREGADLVLAGRSRDALAAMACDLRRLGRQVEIVPTDLSDAEQVKAMVARAVDIFDGRVDILLNGAGGIIPPEGRALVDLSVEDYERTLAANLRACFLTMKFTLPVMIRRQSGRIVSIGGTFGLKGAENLSHYSAAKWGLIGLTRSVALEVGRYGITVNVVCPGYVKSPVVERELATRAAERGCTPADIEADITGHMALRRMVEPQDVAGAVLFLLGDESRSITGQALAVDSGTVI